MVLDRNTRFIWMQTALAIAATTVVAAILWFVAGPRWGLAAGGVGALLLLWRHLSNVSALLQWLTDPQQPVPRGSGVWESVFSELYRLMRANRQAREGLSAAVTRFRAAGTAMPDAVVILDAENHIEWCNPMAERFLGIDNAKDAGQPIVNLVRAPDFAAYVEHGAFVEPFVLRVAREEELTLSLRVIAYGQDQKLLLCRDITQAERIDTMRRDFVANVSHELKTPLTVVNGFLETLVDGKVRFTESRARQVFGMMQSQTDRMLRLVEDLLTLSALESSPGLGHETEIDTGAMLGLLRSDGEALSVGRHRFFIDAGVPALLVGSESELRSALGNLVSNAVHYTPEGGEIRFAWNIRASGEGEFVVSDNGIGFEGRHIARLTERFYRVDQSRSRETGGTGLGLAIVKHVLTRHQASLEIESQPGRGSRFAAVFPSRRIRTVAAATQLASAHSARS